MWLAPFTPGKNHFIYLTMAKRYKIALIRIWVRNTLAVFDWLIDDCLYSAILRFLEQTHCAHMWFYMSDSLFIARFLNIHRSGVLTVLAWLVPHETAAVLVQVLCTPYNHAPCHFMQSHIPKVYACLTVTCHLHFLLNDQDLLCATAVTWGWNGYQNKSQHRKLTLEKKIILPKVLSCLLCAHMWSAALMFYQYFPVHEGICVWMYFLFFLALGANSFVMSLKTLN